MQRIGIKNGTLIAEEGFVILSGTLTEQTGYAGVIAEWNGLLPHFIFFSERPVQEMSRQQEHDMMELCCGFSPQMAQIYHEKEVQAELSESGALLNREEWMHSPRLGMFAVPDVKDEAHLYLGAGIIRKES